MIPPAANFPMWPPTARNARENGPFPGPGAAPLLDVPSHFSLPMTSFQDPGVRRALLGQARRLVEGAARGLPPASTLPPEIASIPCHGFSSPCVTVANCAVASATTGAIRPARSVSSSNRPRRPPR